MRARHHAPAPFSHLEDSMKLFRTFAIAVCATVAVALPLIAQAQGKIEKPKVSHRRRRQGRLLLSAADHRRAPRLFQGRRARRRDQRLRRRLEGVAGGRRRQRRRRFGRVGKHHRPAAEGPQHAGLRIDGSLSRHLDGHRQEQGGRVQVAEGSQGHEDRRQRAGIEHQPAGAAHAGQGRSQGRATSRSSASAPRRARSPRSSRATSTRSRTSIR